MTTIAAQQVILDNALVPPEKRVEIGKCNMRINPTKTQKEPMYQVVLDALALTTCYLAFLIFADDSKIYMHQFWFTINKHDSSYRFKIVKEDEHEPAKKVVLTKKSSRKQSTCVQIQDTPSVSVSKKKVPATTKKSKGIDLLSEAALLKEAQELGHKGDIKSITEVVVD
nr:hypothetical protein [Tanacetum cinerariifolium]